MGVRQPRAWRARNKWVASGRWWRVGVVLGFLVGGACGSTEEAAPATVTAAQCTQLGDKLVALRLGDDGQAAPARDADGMQAARHLRAALGADFVARCQREVSVAAMKCALIAPTGVLLRRCMGPRAG